jgi:hypothetical protein
VRPSSPIGKALVALATLAVAGGTMGLGLVRAEPAAAGSACVAVVVDFSRLGGAVETGCAQGDPSTGLQALGRAGFSDTPRPQDGLICQIDARPACTETTGTAYWSYWYRAPGSSRWVYASEGAGSHNPKPGSSDGWVWQDGGRTPPPSIRAAAICPQLAAAPAPTPTPGPTKTTASGKPRPKANAKPTTVRSRSTRSPTSTAAVAPTAHSADPRPGSTTPTAREASLSPGRPSDGATGGAADRPANTAGGGAIGGIAGLALGGVLVLGLGTATVLRARRGRPT